METTRQNNNRSLTLAGVNKLFSCLNPTPVVIQNQELGFYSVTYKGDVIMHKTLTNVGQELLKRIAGQSEKSGANEE